MTFFLGTLAGGAGVLVLGGSAYVLAATFLSDSTARIRLCAACAMFIALLASGFFVLVTLGMFSPVGALLFIGASAALAQVSRIKQSTAGSVVKGDLRKFKEAGQFVTGRGWRWVTLAVFGLFAAYLLRALVIPPLGWDSLTYHLVRAALWVKDNSLEGYGAPGAWRANYRHFVANGDGMSAWAMLPVWSDAFVPLMWAGVGLMIPVALYSTLRQLGVGRGRSYLGALAGWLLPAISGHLFTAYVDNGVAALVLLAVPLLLEMEHQENTAAGVVAVLALATSLTFKPVALPFAGVGGVLFGYLLYRSAPPGFVAGFVALALTLVIAGPPLFEVWQRTGSFFFPLEDPFRALMRSVWFDAESMGGGGGASRGRLTRWMYFRRLIWDGVPGWWNHLNVGIAFPLLGLIGGFAVGRRIYRREASVVIGGMVLASIVAGYYTVSEGPRTGLNVARYSIAGPALLVALVGTLDSRLGRGVLGVGLACHLVYFLPTNWGLVDARAALWFAMMLVPAAVVAALVWYWARGKTTKQKGAAALATIAMVCALLGSILEPFRQLYRYQFYAEAAVGRMYSNFPNTTLHAKSFSSAPIWDALDEPAHPRKIAITAGWDGKGHNWFAYPFFGHRLQNEVNYVPVAESGRAIDPDNEEKKRAEADFKSWFDRLLERRIQFVAALAPPPIEVKAMEANSRAFELVTTGLGAQNRLYRVNRPEGERSEKQSRHDTRPD